MDSLACYNYNFETSQEQNILKKELPLSIDALGMILNHLDKQSMQASAQVSKTWNQVTVRTAINKESRLIKKFAAFLQANLKLNDVIKEKIDTILNSKVIFNSVSLLEVKTSMITYKELILDILVSLSDDELKGLEQLSKNGGIDLPVFLEHIFTLSGLLKDLNAATPFFQDTIFEDIVIELINIKELDKATEVTNMIRDVFTKGKLCKLIVKELIKINKFEKATKVANMAIYLPKREKLQEVIIKALIKIIEFSMSNYKIDNHSRVEELHKAIKAVNIDYPSLAEYKQLKLIVKELLKINEFEKALEVAQIGIWEKKWKVLELIAKELIEINKSLESLKSLAYKFC